MTAPSKLAIAGVCKTQRDAALSQAVIPTRIESANASETAFTEQHISRLRGKLVHRTFILHARIVGACRSTVESVEFDALHSQWSNSTVRWDNGRIYRSARQIYVVDGLYSESSSLTVRTTGEPTTGSQAIGERAIVETEALFDCGCTTTALKCKPFRASQNTLACR